MTTEDVTYRIRVRIAHSDDEDHFVNMNEFSDGSEELQKQWVKRITDHIWGSQGNSSLGFCRTVLIDLENDVLLVYLNWKF